MRIYKRNEARVAYVYLDVKIVQDMRPSLLVTRIVAKWHIPRRALHCPAPRDSTQRHVSSARYNNDGAAADIITVMRGCSQSVGGNILFTTVSRTFILTKEQH